MPAAGIGRNPDSGWKGTPKGVGGWLSLNRPRTATASTVCSASTGIRGHSQLIEPVLALDAIKQPGEGFRILDHREMTARDLDRLNSQELPCHESFPVRLEDLVIR